MKLRAILASAALIAAGTVAAVSAAIPAQAVVSAAAGACYPGCTPAIGTNRTVVAPGYKLTVKGTNFRPSTKTVKIPLTVTMYPAGQPNNVLSSAVVNTSPIGAGTVNLFAPTQRGKYTVRGHASGQTDVSVSIWVPRVTPPATCKRNTTCTWSISFIEPDTKVTLVAAGGADIDCSTDDESATCTATFAKAKNNVSWRVVTGQVSHSGKINVTT